jgi:hypothetical protein
MLHMDTSTTAMGAALAKAGMRTSAATLYSDAREYLQESGGKVAVAAVRLAREQRDGNSLVDLMGEVLSFDAVLKAAMAYVQRIADDMSGKGLVSRRKRDAVVHERSDSHTPNGDRDVSGGSVRSQSGSQVIFGAPAATANDGAGVHYSDDGHRPIGPSPSPSSSGVLLEGEPQGGRQIEVGPVASVEHGSGAVQSTGESHISLGRTAPIPNKPHNTAESMRLTKKHTVSIFDTHKVLGITLADVSYRQLRSLAHTGFAAKQCYDYMTPFCANDLDKTPREVIPETIYQKIIQSAAEMLDAA